MVCLIVGVIVGALVCAQKGVFEFAQAFPYAARVHIEARRDFTDGFKAFQ